jgi:hypothetical protein
MKASIRKELTEYIKDHLEYHAGNGLDGLDGWDIFNNDYYLIGRRECGEWLEKHDLSVFDAIQVCNEKELEAFGEVQTIFDNAETLVNHLVLWYGLEVFEDYAQ